MSTSSIKYSLSSDYEISNIEEARVTGGNLELVPAEYTHDLFTEMLLNLNERSGVVVNESGSNGTNNGATRGYRINGIYNYAYSFDGTNDYLEIPASEVQLTKNFTIEFRIIPRNLTGKEVVIAKKDNGFNPSSNFEVYFQDGKLTFAYVNGITRTFRDTVTTYTVDEIVHIAIIVTSANVIKFLKNGVVVYTKTLTTPILTNTADIQIGGNPAAEGDYYEGQIDYVRISNIERVTVQTRLQNYSTDNPYAYPKDPIGLPNAYAWGRFMVTYEYGNQGSVGVQLSDDDGATFKYFDGFSWVAATTNDDVNSVQVVDENISSFPVTATGLTPKLVLLSDGDHQVKVTQVDVVAVNDDDVRFGAGTDKTIKIGSEVRPFADCVILDPAITQAFISTTGDTGLVIDGNPVNQGPVEIDQSKFSTLEEAIRSLTLKTNQSGEFTISLIIYSGTQSSEDVIALTVEAIQATFSAYEPSGKELNRQESPLVPAKEFSYIIYNSANEVVAQSTVLVNSPFTVEFDEPGTYLYEIERQFAVKSTSYFEVQPEDFELHVFLALTREGRNDLIGVPPYDIRLEGIDVVGMTMEATEGDTPLIQGTVMDPDTFQPIDISGWDLYLTAKSAIASNTTQFDRQCTIIDGELGQWEVRLTAENTAPYGKYIVTLQTIQSEGFIITSKRFFLSVRRKIRNS